MSLNFSKSKIVAKLDFFKKVKKRHNIEFSFKKFLNSKYQIMGKFIEILNPVTYIIVRSNFGKTSFLYPSNGYCIL